MRKMKISTLLILLCGSGVFFTLSLKGIIPLPICVICAAVFGAYVGYADL